MSRPSFSEEKISLALPINSAYVSAARLTASSISNRMGFGIEDIEDIKAAVSEACIFIINSRAFKQSFQVEFLLQKEGLFVNLSADNKNALPEITKDQMGIMMIQAMMDSINVVNEDGKVTISMWKQLKKK